MSGQKQHVDIKRKLTLRQKLIDKAGNLLGACYIPFIGEGDIASALYNKKLIYGADNDSEKTLRRSHRPTSTRIVTHTIPSGASLRGLELALRASLFSPMARNRPFYAPGTQKIMV